MGDEAELSSAPLKEYSVILTRPFYGMNKQIKQKKFTDKISFNFQFMFSSYA